MKFAADIKIRSHCQHTEYQNITMIIMNAGGLYSILKSYRLRRLMIRIYFIS